MLPDIVGIGAQKAGTTWLYEQLSLHAQVVMSRQKELNYFFGSNSEKWYRSQFATADKHQIKGEVSPGYLAVPEVPSRMHDLIPNAKLLLILRDPTERAFSQWKMARQLGNVSLETPFIIAFRENQRCIRSQGLYSESIRRFATFYPLGQKLWIGLTDQIRADPHSLIRSVYKFIGADPDFCPSALGNHVNVATDRQLISPSDEKECRDFYAPHIEKLERALSVDLSNWTHPGST